MGPISAPILTDRHLGRIEKTKQSLTGSVLVTPNAGPCHGLNNTWQGERRESCCVPRRPQFTHSLTDCMLQEPADCPNTKHGTGLQGPPAPSQSMLTLQPCSGPSPGSGPTSYLLDRIEAARFLGVSRKTMLRFALERRLPVHRLCRKLLFRKADLERFAEAHVVPARHRRPYERS